MAGAPLFARFSLQATSASSLARSTLCWTRSARRGVCGWSATGIVLLAPAFFVCGAHFPAPLSRELQRQLADFEYHEGRSRCVTGTRVTGTRRPLTQLGRRSDGDSKAAGEQARTARSNGRRDALGYSAVGSTRGRDRKRGEPQSQNATFATCTSPSQCAHHFTIVHHYAIAVCFLRALGTAHTPCS